MAGPAAAEVAGPLGQGLLGRVGLPWVGLSGAHEIPAKWLREVQRLYAETGARL